MIKNTIENNKDIKICDKELDILKENFPACFKKNGSFDFTRFKEYLNNKINVVDEGYELKFLGKDYARLIASLDTETIIEPDVEHNNKEENINSENIYITGDNLDGLKHLLKSYQNKIDLIYIDPPYNTGSDYFIYEDDFDFTPEVLSKKLSIELDEANKILDLSKKGSSSHSAWLMFLYPRLRLAHDLLKDDGFIFISIDENEVDNLKLLCKEIFGESNYINTFIWKRNSSSKTEQTKYTENTEYILMLSKSSNYSLGDVYKPLSDSTINMYKHDDKDGRGLYATVSLQKPRDPGPETSYDYKDKYGKIWPCPPKGWRMKESKLRKLEEDNRLVYSGKSLRVKDYWNERKNEGKRIDTLWDDLPENSKGTSEVENLFGIKGVFTNPKPTELLKRIINIKNNPNSVVLDFFSGSGSTAEAVLNLNAKDQGNRKFILIQIPEEIRNLEDATKLGLKTIDEIGIERIKKVSKKLKGNFISQNQDLGFKHFTLKGLSKETIDNLENFDPNIVTAFIDEDNLLEEFGANTILTTWANNDGYGLTKNPDIIDLAGYKAVYYRGNDGNGGHLYFINPGITPEVIDTLLVKYEEENFNPNTIVLFGHSFTWKEIEELERNLARLNKAGNDLKINLDVRY